ncbi:OmpA family protein [Myroides pelagicus]|uniref:OmpA family protein n=1 Tax=Myroides pelagicus TaxID=270914 RepID=UPI002DB75E38|nr:OmpA family protein [Myroides pelagicus]MEC4113449.1 OmpA family protein [Myroides pelagicus]
MKKVCLAICGLVFLSSTAIFAQRVEGKLFDKKKNRPIVDGAVSFYDRNGGRIGTVYSNAQGFYALDSRALVDVYKIVGTAKDYIRVEYFVERMEDVLTANMGFERMDITKYDDGRSSFVTRELKLINEGHSNDDYKQKSKIMASKSNSTVRYVVNEKYDSENYEELYDEETHHETVNQPTSHQSTQLAKASFSRDNHFEDPNPQTNTPAVESPLSSNGKREIVLNSEQLQRINEGQYVNNSSNRASAREVAYEDPRGHARGASQNYNNQANYNQLANASINDNSRAKRTSPYDDHRATSYTTPVVAQAVEEYNDVHETPSGRKELVVDLKKLNKTNVPKVLTLPMFYYAYNSSYLTEANKQVADEIAAYMIKNASARVQVKVYLDTRGNLKYDSWLTGRRADRVIDYLISLGIDKSRLVKKVERVNYDLSRLSVSTSTSPEQENRRCEFNVI